MNHEDDILDNFINDETMEFETDDELNYGLLFDTLDHIGNTDSDVGFEELPIISINKLLPNIVEVYHSKAWNKKDPHPILICVTCNSLNCKHVKTSPSAKNIDELLEQAVSNCDHENAGDWILEDTCINCMLESCGELNIEDDSNLLQLLDTKDLAEYYTWINNLLDEKFKYN